MSINALKIRRKLLRRDKSYFVMCPINDLPFRDKSASLILLLGILHHTEHREHNIPYLKKKLAYKGIIYIDEVLYRPSFLAHKNIKKGVDVSAHEEFVFLDGLKYNLSQGGEINYLKLFNTPFYNFIKKRFTFLVRENYSTYKIIMFIDKIFMHSLGFFFKSFNPGAVTIIWKKNDKR